MTNPRMLQRLIWKDARTVAPLAIAILLGLVVLGILEWFFLGDPKVGQPTTLRPDDRLVGMYAIWMLLPNLFALGAPALLVGGEEESGTLSWLKMLPVPWRVITRSKMIVAGVCWAIVHLASTLNFYLQYQRFDETEISQLMQSGFTVEQFDIHFAGQTVFGIALLLVSFATAYLFRSPISGLVAVAPTMVILAIGFFGVSNYLSTNGYGQSPWWEIYSTRPIFLGLVCLVFLSGLYLVQLAIAAMRFRRSDSSSVEAVSSEVVGEAFRPPRTLSSWYAVALAQKPPSKLGALLWQSLRQFKPFLLAAGTMVLVGSILVGFESRFGPLGALLVSAAFLLIGGSTFYGDSVRKRCVFLYDRGFSPSLVWLTRIIPTLTATLLLGALMLLMLGLFQHWSWWNVASVFFMITVFYALSQLVSLWSPRPILVFFAAPVLFFIGTVALSPLLAMYPWSQVVIWLCCPLFMYASWAAMRYWMSGSRSRWSSAWLAGCLISAVVVPYFLVAGVRWVSMPPLRTEWRQQMMTMDLDSLAGKTEPLAISDPSFTATANEMRAMEINDYAGTESGPLEDRLRKEIQDREQLGRSVSIAQLIDLAGIQGPQELVIGEQAFQSGYGVEAVTRTPTRREVIQARDRDLLVAKALAKWSRVVRELAVAGKADFFQVVSADQADAAFVPIVQYYLTQEQELRKPFEQLDNILISPELRKQSRIAGVVTQWREYQKNPDLGRFIFQVSTPNSNWLLIERMRVERYVDEMAHLILEQLRSGDRFSGVMAQQELQSLYSKCVQFYEQNRIWLTQRQYRRETSMVHLQTLWASDQRYDQIARALRESGD